MVSAVSQYLMIDKPVEKTDNAHFLVFPKGPLVGLGIIAFCCMIGEGAMSDWSTNYMLNIMKSPPEFGAFGLSAFAATMTIGRLFGDSGRQRWGDTPILLVGAVLSIIGMIIILSLWHFGMVIFGFGLVGLGLSNIVPIIYSQSGDVEGIEPGVGIAMATTIGYSGFMFGPPFIGFVADAFDLHKGLMFILFLFIVMLILMVIRNKSNPDMVSK